MSQLIITYKLKQGSPKEAFETWVRNTDYPAMRGLKRVHSFTTHRCLKNLMTGEPATKDYIEIFEIADLDGFIGEDMPGETVQKIMGEFMQFAESPEFIIAEAIS